MKKKLFSCIVGGIILLLTACGTTTAISDSASDIGTEEVIETVTEEDNTQELLQEENQEQTQEQIQEQTVETEEDSFSEMQVHFIDVGQGDATLILCDGQSMLIDAGDDSKGTTVWNYLRKQGVTKLDYLVLTHTDADHIGGADVIVTKLETDTVFMGDFPKDNKVYGGLINALDNKSLTWSTPNVGNTYTLGTATFTILAPNRKYSDPNNSSIALLIQNGENKFLFTGDAEEEAEIDMLANGLEMDCDVLQVGHHGSRTSSTSDFLDAVTPEFAIISCEEGNSYGHPHAETLNKFRSMGVKVYRTDEQGSIVAVSDGKEITWNCAPSDSWQAGESRESSSIVPVITEPVIEMPAATESVVEPPAATEPVIETPVVSEPSSGGMVWKSATGKKYHSINNCGNMNPDKAQQITKEEAERMGLTPCSKCF